MNPVRSKNLQNSAGSLPANPTSSGTKKGLNFDLKKLLLKLRKLWQKLAMHLAFIVTATILLIYLFVVWQIRVLATAEPSPDAESEALLSTRIPKIDKEAISQIQSLEQSSPQVRSLFNDARNNPFHE